MFLFGAEITTFNKENKYINHFSHYAADKYIGYVKEPVKETARSFRTTIAITSVEANNEWEKATGNCIVYFSKDSVSERLRYGDLVLFDITPDAVLPPSNPAQFDYQKWLAFNKVYHQVYVPSSRFTLLGLHQGNILVDYAFQLREKCLSIFRQNNLAGQDYAVLSALLLGDEHEISQETINAYQASGTLHVLSVSGMHVGIIYLALSFILSFFGKSVRAKFIKANIIVLTLWFYSAITGLAPAVLRSATMLTFMIYGNLRKNPASIYNSLLASALFLLLINPFLVMQASFQLSYLAVIGIVFLQQNISSIFTPDNYILSKIWDVISVSISAQLATFPLGLFYFHQFPNYFILSNLLIIPLSSLIIYIGILLLAISSIHSAAHIFATVLGKLLHFLNDSVARIETLPYSTIKGISITVSDTWLIYLILISLILYFIYNNYNLLVVSLFGCILLLGSEAWEFEHQREQRIIAVYNVPRKTAIAFIDSRQCALLGDSTLINNKNEMRFNIFQHWWSKGIDDDEATYLNENAAYQSTDLNLKKSFIDFNGIKILWLNDKSLLNTKEKVKVDLLVLSRSVNIHLKEILERFSPAKIIIDSSNSLYAVTKWMNEAGNINTPCYSVREKGAFILDATEQTF